MGSPTNFVATQRIGGFLGGVGVCLRCGWTSQQAECGRPFTSLWSGLVIKIEKSRARSRAKAIRMRG